MKKQLSEMTLEELYYLFPIILVKHNPQYREWYNTEKENLLKSINTHDIFRINHIGSSAVKGLISKPTVDILLEIREDCNISHLTDSLVAIGWGLMQEESEPMKLAFVKGYTPEGFADKVYHLHVKYMGDWDELYFRDYLIKHPNIAMEYGKLKLDLLKDFKHNKDGYTKAKTDFIVKYSEIAKRELNHIYKPNQ